MLSAGFRSAGRPATFSPARPEQILGYLASTSYASKAVLGDRATAFEDELRRSLAALATRGPLDKLVDYTVIIARR